jgi:hypothetical protein
MSYYGNIAQYVEIVLKRELDFGSVGKSHFFLAGFGRTT